MSGADLALAGWVPYAIRPDAGQHHVDWCHLGEATFAAPFFEQTIATGLGKPFTQLFARSTPIETLLDWSRARPGLAPAAFIFHGSRCGSTLVCQLARALPRTIVISEAPPIDHVLRAQVPDATRVEWLRALMSALGQPRRGDERVLVVKFDAWHVMDLALVQQAFPGVPCVFVYREPAEVIASQMRMPGQFMHDARLRSSLLGAGAPALLGISDREESCARVLAAIYAAALASAASGALGLLNFEELPEAGVSRVIQWCTFDCSDDLRARLQQVAEFDAKNPSLPYDATEGSTRRPPSERALNMAARFVAPYYARLEAIRLSGSVRTGP